MCTLSPRACAASASARTSPTEYTVPASVAWVRLTARGGTSAARRLPASSAAASAGAGIFPSTVARGTLRAFPPDQNSVAPHSLVWRCETSAQKMAPYGAARSAAAKPLATVPVPTG
jgi:hypothetical protein